MKTYNIKVDFNGYWMEYKEQYFISNNEDYLVYLKELNNKFIVSESEIKNNETWVGHEHSMLTGISGMLSGMIENKEEREPMLVHLKLLHAKVLSDQLKSLLIGHKLVINKNGGYFSIKPDDKFEIVETKSKDYSEIDIKINHWYGGKHYYAKIRNIDVVDKLGNVKWNTEIEARNKAKEYLLTL